MPSPLAHGDGSVHEAAGICNSMQGGRSCLSLSCTVSDSVASIKTCLRDNATELLRDACRRLPWTVSIEDWYAGCFYPKSSTMASAPPSWLLQEGAGPGQLRIGSLT